MKRNNSENSPPIADWDHGDAHHTQLARRDPEAPQETWLIHYGDVQVGVIAERVGNPTGTARWQWSYGFHPGSPPADHAQGTAETFDQARAAFAAA